MTLSETGTSFFRKWIRNGLQSKNSTSAHRRRSTLREVDKKLARLQRHEKKDMKKVTDWFEGVNAGPRGRRTTLGNAPGRFRTEI